MAIPRLSSVNANDAFDKPKDYTTFLLLHSVNHKLFGRRDPKQYGSTTMAQIEESVAQLGKELGVNIIVAQSDIEGELCELIHYSRCLGGVIFNAGAYAHYSHALADAIEATPTPVIEVHISNTYAREEFRHKTVIARVCSGTITGAGMFGYEMGLRCAINRAKEQQKSS